jgi:hypothetical protein
MQAPEFRAPVSDVQREASLSRRLRALGARLGSITSGLAIRMVVVAAVLLVFVQAANAAVVAVVGHIGGAPPDNAFVWNNSGAVVTIPGVTIDPGVNFIVLGAHIRGTTATTSASVVSVVFTPSGGGAPQAFTIIAGASDTFMDTIAPVKNAVRTEMWRLVNPGVGNGGSNGQIVVTLSASAFSVFGWTTFSGVDTNNPIQQATVAKGKGQFATVNFNTFAGDMIVDAMTTDDTAAPSPVTGQTLQYDGDTTHGANGCHGQSGTKASTFPTTTNTYDLGGLTPYVIGLIDIRNSTAPTAVEFTSFSASKFKSGDVVLQWDTGYEVNNLGFNIYRDENGVRTRLTPDLVAGSALLVGGDIALAAGRSYLWADKVGKRSKDAQYWLEEVDLNGQSTWFGPAAAQRSNGSQPKGGNATLLSALTATQGARGTAFMGPIERTASIPTSGGFSTAAFQTLSSFASQSAAKISVKQEGWYRVSQPQLVAAGISPNVDPTRLQLFVDGQEIAIIVNGDKDRTFDPSDSIEFYGIGLDTPYTDSRTYWLVAGTQAGKRIGKAAGQGGATGGGSFPYTIERKDKLFYVAAVRNGDAENFFGAIVTNRSVDQSVTLQNVAPGAGAAAVEIVLQAFQSGSHDVAVLLNGSAIGTISWGGMSQGTLATSVPQSLLTEGANVFTLTSQNGSSDVSLVDHIRVTYAHTFKAESNGLRFSAIGGQGVAVDGFSSSDIRLVDVTDPAAVQDVKVLVKAVNGGYSITATAPGAGNRLLLAFTDGVVKGAAGVSLNKLSNLTDPNQGANLVIITRADFSSSLAALKSLRQSQGLSVTVVDVEDIYDEFSFGQKTPYAIKDFLSFAKSNWKKAPQFVLLAGGASFDPRNYLNIGDYDAVPTKLVDTVVNETASDDWFADFKGEALPELAIGRLPARTAGELATMVSKIVSYDSQSPSESALLVSDRNDGFDFDLSTAVVKDLLPTDIRAIEVNRNLTDDATARAEVLDAINQGQKLVNYAGHGSASIWRGNLLTATDAASLSNGSSLSLFVSMTCQNGFFIDPRSSSMAEALMKSNAGAVAVWASTGITSPSGQGLMDREVIRQLFSGGTIGQATAQAKAAMLDTDVRRTWILFGDPSARVK